MEEIYSYTYIEEVKLQIERGGYSYMVESGRV
jgi:hypothetical protein